VDIRSAQGGGCHMHSAGRIRDRSDIEVGELGRSRSSLRPPSVSVVRRKCDTGGAGEWLIEGS